MESEPDTTPPQRLAHFELLEEIGRGGMGIVYRARDVRLGRQVAIKLLPAAFSTDSDRRSRLLREARAAAQLNHPNIATLYEVGEAEWTPPAGEDELGGDGPRRVVFLAMEYVQGEDLGPRLEGDGLSLQQTLDFGIQISDGLAAAHAAGVIHRDLKPQNLRITPDGRIKILDFGLAKLVQEGSVVDEPMLTAHGAIVGTAPYMAPEQLQGASEVDSRCDLFSFGVVLYQMLTGRLPFNAPRLVDYVKALTHQTPDPPSHSNPEVSPQLEQVVERLLAKEPADRYPSALDVGRDLKDIARGRPIEPPPSTTRPGDSIFSEVLQPFRRPWMGWALGALFLAALVGVWWGSSRPASEGPAASEPVKMVYMPLFENVSGDAEKDPICRGLGLALANSFQEVPVLVVQDQKKAEDLGVRMQLRGSCQRFGDEDAAVLLDLIDLETGILVWWGR
jgi:serine/threonine protein kinase